MTETEKCVLADFEKKLDFPVSNLTTAGLFFEFGINLKNHNLLGILVSINKGDYLFNFGEFDKEYQKKEGSPQRKMKTLSEVKHQLCVHLHQVSMMIK